MNRKRSKGKVALTPFPKSAVAARRIIGVSELHQAPPGNAGASTHAQGRAPADRSASASPWPPAKLDSVEPSSANRTGVPLAGGMRHRRVLACLARRRPAARRLLGTRLHAQGTRADDRLLAREQLGRQLLHAPAGADDAGRGLQRGERDRAQELEGEARDAQSPRRSRRSKAAVISAAGAPPWSACGSHGPRACSLGTKRPPSCEEDALAHRLGASVARQASDGVGQPSRVAQRRP